MNAATNEPPMPMAPTIASECLSSMMIRLPLSSFTFFTDLPLKGVAYLRDTINIVRARFNKALEIGGIILTFYHSTYSLDNDVLEALEQAFPNKVFKTKISNNTKVAQAPSHGKDIFAYSPKSNGAKQYLELAGEVIEQETTRER